MEDQQPEPSPRERYLSIILTLFFGGGFLLFLIMVSGLFFLYVTLAVLAIGGVGYLHYILWGQSLTNEVAVEQEMMKEETAIKASEVKKLDTRISDKGP